METKDGILLLKRDPIVFEKALTILIQNPCERYQKLDFEEEVLEERAVRQFGVKMGKFCFINLKKMF